MGKQKVRGERRPRRHKKRQMRRQTLFRPMRNEAVTITEVLNVCSITTGPKVLDAVRENVREIVASRRRLSSGSPPISATLAFGPPSAPSSRNIAASSAVSKLYSCHTCHGARGARSILGRGRGARAHVAAGLSAPP